MSCCSRSSSCFCFGLGIPVLLFVLGEAALYLFADRHVAAFFKEVMDAHPFAFDLFKGITTFGNSQWYFISGAFFIVVFSLLLARGGLSAGLAEKVFINRSRIAFAMAAISMTGLAVNFLKIIFGRARPELLFEKGTYGFNFINLSGFEWYSMPSGHTTTAFTLACLLSLFFPKYKTAWISLAAVVGVSRVAVLAHYPSDIVAGAVLGWFGCALFFDGTVRYLGLFFPLTRRWIDAIR